MSAAKFGALFGLNSYSYHYLCLHFHPLPEEYRLFHAGAVTETYCSTKNVVRSTQVRREFRRLWI